MKPAPFAFHDPDTVEEAVALLAEHGDDAKVLAGGQSLIPLLSFRLARPAVLVDINRVRELSYITAGEPDEPVRIGALTRQVQIERSTALAENAPLLRAATRYVAHPQIRSRGTVGGSVAHADPAAELPVAMVALEATMITRGQGGCRRIPAEAFFVSHLTTALTDEELLVEIEIPPMAPRTGVAFHEFTRRHGDYALGGAAAALTLDAGGTCSDARVVLLAGADVPLRVRDAEALLVGQRVDQALATEAAAAAAREAAPVSNAHGDASYRRRLIGAMCEQAIVAAAGRGQGVA